MVWTEIWKVLVYGIVEGITEWLPISSTGHMILLNRFIRLNVSVEFWDLFLVVIQMGAILAVAVLYWERLLPFDLKNGGGLQREKCFMWLNIVIATVPAAIGGILLEDLSSSLFYNETSVAVMLILFGIFFLIIEQAHKGKTAAVDSVYNITWTNALVIGAFQLIAAVFPGTSRSGATIVGALLIGISRTAAAEFTFFLAIPVMAGASILKLAKFGRHITSGELLLLATGMLAAYLVSMMAIRFLVDYVKKHDFTFFGWYRIVLGLLVLALPLLRF